MAKKPAEIPQHEQVILEPELEEALKNATDAEMCDIAGEAQTLWPEAAVSSGSRSFSVQCKAHREWSLETWRVLRHFLTQLGPIQGST